jgi:putative ABC transport system ATP-binding protein
MPRLGSPSAAAGVTVTDLEFDYGRPGFALRASRLDVVSSEAVAFVGPSGSGKTTFLYLVAGILQARRGSIRVGDVDVQKLGDAERRRFRSRMIGFVFQELELIEYLSAMENIVLPVRLFGDRRELAAARERAAVLAARVGIAPQLGKLPGALSQGERQRVALARALINAPPLLLADEPTSSLDARSASSALDLLFELVRESGTTLLMLTHDTRQLPRFDRVVSLPDFDEAAP